MGMRERWGRFGLRAVLCVAAAVLLHPAGAALGGTARPAERMAPFGPRFDAREAPSAAPFYAAKGQGRGGGGEMDGLSPEEKARIQRQYKEWKSMPPDRQQDLRRRMEEWNKMPTRDRQRYQERYRQWQQVPPDERRKLEKNLKQWEELSPQERESIRKRFKN